MTELEGYVYKRPTYIKVSNMLAMFFAGFAVALLLPEDTNFLLLLACVTAVAYLTDRIHFVYLERPIIHQGMREHFDRVVSRNAKKGGKH